MTHCEFIRSVDVVLKYGHKVLVEYNYSEQELEDLLDVLANMLLEAYGER